MAFMPQFDQFRWDEPEANWEASSFPQLNRMLQDTGTRRLLVARRVIRPATPEPRPIVGGLAGYPPKDLQP